MPVYSYKGVDALGRQVCGTFTADTAPACRQALREKGLQLIDFGAVAFRKPRQIVSLVSRAKRDEQIADFARHLSLLLRTGTTLVDALDVLSCHHHGRFVSVIKDLRDRIASGVAFHTALEAHPSWFDEVVRTSVSVGQASGHMDRALSELAAFLHERQTVRGKISAALAYPMVLCVLGAGVVLFLMTYVIPQLLEVLNASGQSLPWSTALLKNSSDLIVGHWIAMVVGTLTVGIGMTTLWRWEPARSRWHTLQLKLPIVGPLIAKNLVGQVAQTMAMLLRTGVAFLDAVVLVRSQTRHMLLASELSSVESCIRRGTDIASPLENSRIFPPLVSRVMSVGQETGELTTMLEELSIAYRTEVRLAISKFTSTLEPLLIVAMSIVVGFVVYATMMPILEATRTIR